MSEIPTEASPKSNRVIDHPQVRSIDEVQILRARVREMEKKLSIAVEAMEGIHACTCGSHDRVFQFFEQQAKEALAKIRA